MTASLQEKPSENFVAGGLGFGLVFALIGAAAAGRLPFAASWLIETVIFTGAFAGMTVYKANRWGWAWTGYTAAVCLAEAFAYVTGLSASHVGGGLSWAAGGLIGVGWLCMLRMGRHREPAPAPVTRVVHEHVFYGLPGSVPFPDATVTGNVVQVPSQQQVTPPRRSAIEAPRVQDSFARWLAGKVPVRVVRR
jgi:hypothetical protein